MVDLDKRIRCAKSDSDDDTRYCLECLQKPCRWFSGWRPNKSNPTPTPERIAAALALAEEIDRAWPVVYDAAEEKLVAYRATAPKLRTEAKVDAEIAALSRRWSNAAEHGASTTDPTLGEFLKETLRLCAEPTTPTPRRRRKGD